MVGANVARCSWRLALGPLLACALLAASPARAQDGEAPAGEDAIAPGQEELLAEMLGRGADLAGGCRWAGASVEKTFVVARYACPGVEVVIELRRAGTAAEATPAAHTAQFDIGARGGAVPPGLLDAIAARVRAREAAFHWARVQPAPTGAAAEPRPAGDHASRGALAGLAAAALVACSLAYVAIRRASVVDRVIQAGSAGRGGRLLAWAAPLTAAIALCAAAHGAIRALGRVAGATLMGEGAAAIAPASAAAIACALGASLSGAILARLAPLRRRAPILAAVVAAWIGIGYPPSLRRGELHRFGDLSTPAPGSTFTDTFPARPRITYHVNDLGFRDPPFSRERPPGVVRVALVGDSYVFGIGVLEDETLSASLAAELARRRPDLHFEVLNLGIPGDNLASHVSLYAEAATQLDPQFTVVCLTLPNDLSRWDDQVAHDEARRTGAFSLARWLIGDAAVRLWDHLLLDRSITPEGLAHLDREMDRLRRVHAEASAAHGGEARALFLLTYGRADPRLSERLAEVEGAPLIEGDAAPDDFIRGDGHPTAAGNRRFAAWIADAIERDPSAAMVRTKRN